MAGRSPWKIHYDPSKALRPGNRYTRSLMPDPGATARERGASKLGKVRKRKSKYGGVVRR